ncbi:tRNA (guanosine(37)-N1)-methyltransferase TrmD [Myxococcota bacterium]|nr:tRNA (guanosine(37)-N1)-methyltransferase TrmD [Myxococcota bacterium]
MRFDLLTLHPELCLGPVSGSIIGRARAAGLLDVRVHDLRTWAEGRHKQADDAPYGGGSGMVMKVDVVDRGIAAVRQEGARVVLLDPVAPTFTQRDALRLARLSQLVLVCGHYEGVDARVREHLVDEALSIGDYVLTGGELAALVVLDAVARQVPGVLGNPDSLGVESFTPREDGRVLLEAPQYTRPREYRGWEVPDVLLSGHHGRVEAWRHEQALALTRRWRPDLLARPPEDPD